jgi:hypothetical protein
VQVAAGASGLDNDLMVYPIWTMVPSSPITTAAQLLLRAAINPAVVLSILPSITTSFVSKRYSIGSTTVHNVAPTPLYHCRRPTRHTTHAVTAGAGVLEWQVPCALL